MPSYRFLCKKAGLPAPSGFAAMPVVSEKPWIRREIKKANAVTTVKEVIEVLERTQARLIKDSTTTKEQLDAVQEEIKFLKTANESDDFKLAYATAPSHPAIKDMTTPTEYREIKRNQDRVIDAAQKKIAAALERAKKCPPPANKKAAHPLDLEVGAIIWFRGEKGASDYWVIVDQVVNVAKGIFLTDGASYDLVDAYVDANNQTKKKDLLPA